MPVTDKSVQPDALQGERLGGQAGCDSGRIPLART